MPLIKLGVDKKLYKNYYKLWIFQKLLYILWTEKWERERKMMKTWGNGEKERRERIIEKFEVAGELTNVQINVFNRILLDWQSA